MIRPKLEDFTKDVNQVEYSQAIEAYHRACEKYMDFKDELEVRKDLELKKVTVENATLAQIIQQQNEAIEIFHRRHH